MAPSQAASTGTRKSARLAAAAHGSPARALAMPVPRNRPREAARRALRAQELPPRRSARIRDLPPKSYKPPPGSPPSPPPSRSRPPDNAYGARKPVASYDPQRPQGIDLDTPRRRIRWGERRRGAKSLKKVSFSGLNCSVSGEDSKMGVQIIHHTDRAADPDDLRQMEITFGEDKDILNLDTRGNRMPLNAALHAAYDNGLIVFSPTVPDLTKLHNALVNKEVTGWTEERSPHKNSQGFIHHEEVFPLDGTHRKLHVVPTALWSKKSVVSIQGEGDSQPKPHYAPFEDADGNEILPLITTHCSPYFVAKKAYWALTDKKAVLPAYMATEEHLIREIGEIMTGKVVPPLPKA
ncbi:hypothetical protein K523DRAFT_415431 [Schizophyllum commune Tattone D]|nr:hypothetical protein K523DRAFT_415431 [Schizophyllum commune Tattone D]